ncbi:hypothetical protein [Paenibacillus cremeus]|uniref:Uncharacterized protein n=1 Tax=Paenibacillus cremeus TaxID=2163881 RepID=A0A559K6P6_9BACL|nr:hypothetical protein [Paenibacillus cremeus]TVY07812.1 hypothetical protein FPZ49_21890 [Paenibacillus cremeus]
MIWRIVYMALVSYLLITCIQLPAVLKLPKREKVTFFILSAFNIALTCLLIKYPELPGPTHLINAVFDPISRLLMK